MIYYTKETENNHQIEIDVPGFSAKELSVEIKDDLLTVSKTPKETNQRRANFYVFSVPSNVDCSKITSSLKDGVLLVTLPKLEEKKSKKIEIQT